MTGQTISHYRIREKLGEGGMGVVYKAEDVKLGRVLALKFLSGEGAEERERFLREARAAAALNHPNICTVYEVDEEHGFLAMELVEGPSLKERIAERPLKLDEALGIARQVCEGLQAAHEKGIVHRDIKPGNILLTPKGQVKITDFGLAAMADRTRITKTGALMGTPAYMSPEQAKGESSDRRTDIWSLGIVLYEMLSGRLPFARETEHAVSYAVVHEDPEPVTALRSGVPVELDRIISKALRKDPGGRYQHVEEMRVDTLALLEKTETSRTGKAGIRSWVLVGAIAFAVVLAGLIAWIRMAQVQTRETVWSIRPLTSFGGMEVEPCWSPDGSFFAYSHYQSGNLDLFVMPSGGGAPVRLTKHSADDYLPRWSPDGRQIAFVSNRDGRVSVYVMPALGGSERKVAETHEPLERRGRDNLGAFPWSPDGRQLLFSRFQSGGMAVWKIDLVTGSETRITQPGRGANDVSASWSFDGGSIAFARGAKLMVATAAGGEPKTVLEEEHLNLGPAWSPDSRRIVFSSNRSGAINLWEVVLATGRVRQITSGPGPDQSPSTGRTGKLAYDVVRHQTDVYRMELHNRRETQLTFHGGNNFPARLSPDERKVVYQSNRTGNTEIWELDLETKEERQLTNHPGADTAPDLSPDGREILFVSNREKGRQLWIMKADGSGLRRLRQDEVRPGAPKWSPDGDWIGYLADSDRGGALWIAKRDGSQAEPRLFGVLNFGWYRDSRHVIYLRPGKEGGVPPELRVANLLTGKESSLGTGMHAEPAVSPDGEALTFCRGLSGRSMELYLLRLTAKGGALPLPAGPPEQLTRGQGAWHAHNGGFSADGKRILYTRATDEGDIYVIENYR